MKVHTTLQKRQILAAIACVLSVGFALWSCLSLESTAAEDVDAPSQAVQEKAKNPAKHSAKDKKKPGVRRDVAGAAQADAAKALRDPFTAAHEQEGETAAVLAAGDAAAQEDTAKDAAAGMEPTANGWPSAYPTMPATMGPGGRAGNEAPSTEFPMPAPQPVLKGIVTGRHGNMALLSDGVTTAAVAPGETFAGWVLVAVGEAGAELASDSGGLHLDLAGF